MRVGIATGLVVVVALKGFAENVPTWQVLGAGVTESRFEAFHSTALTPIVGRDEEIDLLMRRWAQAKRGDGCVVLISGEPGIGKSRIAQTVLEGISAEPYTRLLLAPPPGQRTISEHHAARTSGRLSPRGYL